MKTHKCTISEMLLPGLFLKVFFSGLQTPPGGLQDSPPRMASQVSRLAPPWGNCPVTGRDASGQKERFLTIHLDVWGVASLNAETLPSSRCPSLLGGI